MADTAVMFIEISVLVTLIVTLMSCICCRKNHKNTEHDPEYKPQDPINNNRNLLEINAENGDHGASEEMAQYPEHEQTRLKSTIPRELPELPPGEIAENQLENPSDVNYAIVSDIPRTSQTSIASLPGSLTRSIEVTAHAHPSLSDDSSFQVPNDTNAYATVKPNPSRQSHNYNEIPPPVPEKHFEQGEPSSVASSNLSAASAVAGIADIPYMTSPSRTVPDLNRHDTDFLYDGNPRTPCYTSISVREPLENILSRMTHHDYIEEPTYSFVSDDSDQVYAEIQPDKRTPPAPPTVESLKNVAQAQHSRQASCSSFTASDATSPHSPNSERNLNHGSWGPQPTIEEPSGQYSVIIKPKKQTPIEELYATVQKDSSKSTGTRAKQSALGHEPSHHGANLHGPRNDNNESKSTKGNSLVRRSSSKDDPNYEKILDSHLRTMAPGTSEDNPNEREQFKGLRTNGVINSRENRNGSDPGYETMPGSKRYGDYETIPDGYETIPGYEQVPMPYQQPYPNYERVDYAVNNGTATATVGENTYWQISSQEETNDPFYEKINRLDDDPNYEKVKTVCEQSDEESSEPGYEQVKPSTLPQNTYEKVRECNELLNFDPGYEKIHDNRVELRVEWDGDAPTYSDTSSSAVIAHLHHGPHASNSSEILPDLFSPPAPSRNSIESFADGPLNSVNGISIYNMAYTSYADQARSSSIPVEREENISSSSTPYNSEHHGSLL